MISQGFKFECRDVRLSETFVEGTGHRGRSAHIDLGDSVKLLGQLGNVVVEPLVDDGDVRVGFAEIRRPVAGSQEHLHDFALAEVVELEESQVVDVVCVVDGNVQAELPPFG